MEHLEKTYSGKVRDLYAIGDKYLLVVASDRLSAFDVVFPDPIPGKGAILTQMSNCWFTFFKEDIATQVVDLALEKIIVSSNEDLKDRSIIVKKLRPIKIEAVTRGYLAGGGWKEYQQKGSVSGVKLPSGLKQAEKLPEPIFTPSTKAEVGAHDQAISMAEAALIIGEKWAETIKEKSLQLYQKAAAYAKARGIIIADTKFEFGLDENGILTLMDEVLTPDSSRFWDEKSYRVGEEPLSFDKQYVRNWLEAIHWNKKPPAPRLPKEVVEETQKRYRTIFTLLFGT